MHHANPRTTTTTTTTGTSLPKGESGNAANLATAACNYTHSRAPHHHFPQDREDNFGLGECEGR